MVLGCGCQSALLVVGFDLVVVVEEEETTGRVDLFTDITLLISVLRFFLNPSKNDVKSPPSCGRADNTTFLNDHDDDEDFGSICDIKQ
jgi:hypothetical protein